ncbi:MAG: hypothetical protein AAGJ40_21220, partial [Planctomycetota bacterium]
LGLRERGLSASICSPVSCLLVWSEPKIQITGSAQWNVDRSSIETTGVDVVSDWFAARLAGVIEQSTDVHSMRLSGPAQFKMDVAAERLSVLTGMQMVAEGVHQTPLTIQIASGHGDSAFTIDGSLGWESADAAGMLFGPASIPFTMTESTIDIAAARIPVMGASRMASRMIGPQVAPLSYDPSRGDQWRRENELTTGDYGEITVTGQVRYRPELLVQLQPGPIARNVRLTPEMTENWLKYLAPIAADAARLEGSFGAELDEALIDLDRPERSRVRGRLNVRQVVMNAGPLADQVIASARQLQSLAALGQSSRPPRTGRTLVTLPAQVVDFQVADGTVSHRALMMEIDRARVVTSGNVMMDGRLDLVAQIPLEPSWLGSDLRGLAGQQLTLPIDGTLSRPSLDSAGVRRVVADLGVRAAQQAGTNYLQEQIGRGQQQLEDSFQKGLNKLFGR